MYFFLLVLEISLHFDLNTSQKQGGFSKILLKKNLEFFSSKRNNTIAFNLLFLLLSAEVDLVSKKLSREKDAMMACDTSHVKIVFALLIKVIALYLPAFLV